MFLALILMGGIFIFTFGVLIMFGAFSDSKIYDKETRERLTRNIYMEQQLVKLIHEDLDALSKSSNIPFIGTRWWVRHDLKKMGTVI